VRPPIPTCRPFSEPYDRSEVVADACMHGLSLAFALAGLLFLTRKADGLPTFQNASVWIYCIALVTMCAASAAYNIWPVSSAKLLLRRFDHSAIFVFIAATYTPFIAQSSHLEPNKALLIAIWTAAGIGVILKVGFPGRLERLSIVLCLALGWSGVLAYEAVFRPLPPLTIYLIVTGGVLYSAGVVFHLWDRLRFQNVIWHAFVFTAAAVQFFAVFNVVSAAATGKG
jgi:hemolysin III